MPPVHVAQLLAHPAVRSAIERSLAARGVHGDTSIIHVDPREEAMLRMLGGVGTINPRTGLRQFYNPDAGHGDPTGAAGVGGGTGDIAGGGTNPGGLGGGVGGALRDFLDRAAGNFGSGWGSRGVAGGYGNASTGASSTGSGAGYGGAHSGQNYYSQTYGGLPGSGGQGGYGGSPLPSAPAMSNMPAAAPVTLTPMMSDTATTDLTGGRFGALPAFATTPYQIGMAPSSYPTPGVNVGVGAPGYAGNPLPGQGGGGGGGLPGGGAVAPGGAGAPPTVASLGGPVATLRAAAGQSGEGYQGTWADAFNQANRNILAQKVGQQLGPTSTLGVLLQMLGGGPPREGGQQSLPGSAMGSQAPRPAVQTPRLPAPAYVAPRASAPLLTRPAATAPLTLLQQMSAATRTPTPGAYRW